MLVSGYRAMWLFVMFDLPTDTKKARKAYAQFRKSLLKDGFTMMQYSVYIRNCASEESAAVHEGRVVACLPDEGMVDVLKVTDKQFGRINRYFGKIRRPPPEPAMQLTLF